MVNFTEMCQREPKKSSRSTSRDGVAKPQSWIMEAQRRFGPYPRDRAGLARGLHHCPCGVGAARPRCERQKLTDIDAATGWGLATVQLHRRAYLPRAAHCPPRRCREAAEPWLDPQSDRRRAGSRPPPRRLHPSGRWQESPGYGVLVISSQVCLYSWPEVSTRRPFRAHSLSIQSRECRTSGGPANHSDPS